MAIRLVDVIGFTACSGFSVTSLSSYRQFSQSQFFTLGTDIRNLPNGTIFQTTSMKVTKTSNAVNVYNSNNVLLTSCTGISFSSTAFFGLAFAIDDATHKGSCVNCYNASGYYFATTQEWITTDTTDLYNAIIGSEVPTYTWQSVPSISGKNGILSLVTLDSESINDGEPVSGAAVSVFDQNPLSGNNVKDIVDGNTPLIPSAVDVTAAFIISNPPVGELASRILAAKKDSIPESIEDADKTVSIPANASNVTMPGLDENSQYYFAIFVADATGDTAVSDPKDIYTSGDEGWLFDYTGQIQTFVAPKTGIYSLETWGAQGGDATDGTLTARGGYGAYAYGEVLLQQGETIYINVGGQNGYGGGGGYIPPQETIDENKCKSVSFANAYGVDVDYSGWVLDKLSVFASYDYLTTGYPLNCYNDGNTRDTITYNNGEVVFNGSNYNLSSIAYALSQTYDNVTAITFDLAIGSTASGYACGNVDLINISDQKTVSDSKRVMIAYSGTQRTDADFVATDGSYHTYTKEFSTPISGVNYIAFDKNAANISIKNVKLILG